MCTPTGNPADRVKEGDHRQHHKVAESPTALVRQLARAGDQEAAMEVLRHEAGGGGAPRYRQHGTSAGDLHRPAADPVQDLRDGLAGPHPADRQREHARPAPMGR